jgi:hypothetical protein
MTFTNTQIFVADEPDEDMVQTRLQVLDLSREDWNIIVHALRSNDFYFDKAARSLAKDIETEILANLTEGAL